MKYLEASESISLHKLRQGRAVVSSCFILGLAVIQEGIVCSAIAGLSDVGTAFRALIDDIVLVCRCN